MAYDPGALETALAAAVGDDPALIVELRRAFLESARLHLDSLRAAATTNEWQESAYRLKGLAASFGATALMDAADAAAEEVAGTQAALRLAERALARFGR
ncbi:MAG: Hpt domain-containing protein [Sphingomonas sanxanigenens]|uniref:Hpt domain-containing protein n=1 Tax=Sphingomonas sanxanigenens TaxID=397260 RepID=A0A2W5BYI2_9SPHN|nr:MAG: Hpt domain-containing protein [Sphingomonas sanxanigenens]